MCIVFITQFPEVIYVWSNSWIQAIDAVWIENGGSWLENDFQSVILKVTNAFLALGLTIQKIHDIEIQISFPTEELSNILKTVDDLDQNVREKEKKNERKR